MEAPATLRKRIRELTGKQLGKNITPQEKTELENILADKRRQLCVTKDIVARAKKKLGSKL